VKVKELMEELAKFSADAEVILQQDAEGNGYSPLYAVDHDAVYVAKNTYSGDVYSTEWTASDACMSEEEWDDVMRQPRCVVLAPTN
jgi:hypothetical protein